MRSRAGSQPEPVTRTTRLLAAPVVAARRAVSLRFLSAWVIRQVASSSTSTERDEECTSPHTSVTSKSSRIARTASDAAAETASSNSAPSAYAETLVVEEDVASLRRVSRYWRTRRVVGLRRRAPVDVAQVVAGDVLAQRVEGQVAGGRVVARHPVEIADQTGVEGAQDASAAGGRGAPRRRPSAPAAEQASGSVRTCTIGPTTVDAARQRRDLDRLGALRARWHQRQPQRAGLPRDLEPDRRADQGHPERADRDLGGGRLARGHPVGVDPEPAAGRWGSSTRTSAAASRQPPVAAMTPNSSQPSQWCRPTPAP